MKFSSYLKLQEEYNTVFNKIFEKYYNKGYFGSIPKEEIKETQYKWFCKLVHSIVENKHEDIIPFITNHNNKITRTYFSKITGTDIKLKGKKEIIELLNKD
jgi:transcription termination factor NusB